MALGKIGEKYGIECGYDETKKRFKVVIEL
jgi:hypothetical protein